MVGFFERLGRGWYLTKVSLRMIREEKQLLLLPVISGITLGLVVLSFIGGIVGLFMVGNLAAMGGNVGTVVLVVLVFLFYVVTYFVAIYFNAALMACATIKLQGGKPTLGDGFHAANQNLGLLFSWAVTAATVGMIIRAVQERLGFIGKMVMGIAGMAWTIAIYFVVPVIIYEKLSPFKAVKRSLSILRGTWGEALGGTFGLGIIFGLLALAGLAFIFVGIYLTAVTLNPWFIVGFVIAALIFWMALAIVYAAAEGILLAALYRYAVTGQLSPGFNAALYQNPWGAAGYYEPPAPARQGS